ncbi:hypothetical protein HPB50_019414 [Hyalomma asiaticum]|uniref:Uncharacterized protein n=1 Tax=Hyalomma asiaticum TaxID=266040 RepID=A0ACB7RLZ1_HYAAI|nr:hypothetical protein HPB50_019414 [Hyalomma asiaticum]
MYQTRCPCVEQFLKRGYIGVVFAAMPVDGPRYSPSLRHQRNRPVHPDSVFMDRVQIWDEEALLLLIERFPEQLESEIGVIVRCSRNWEQKKFNDICLHRHTEPAKRRVPPTNKASVWQCRCQGQIRHAKIAYLLIGILQHG